jgi:hypothetical protein
MTVGTGLTEKELATVEALASAWNCFLKLPIEHPDDQAEFRRAIHCAQNIVLSRPARRSM